MKMSGNTILVTGGGSGIGQALAQRFHDLGNTVIVTGRRKDALAEAIAGRERMHAMPLDVTSARDVETFAQHVVSEHPALNILFNNAGIMRLEVLDRRRVLDDAEDTIATNLLGPIRLTNALVEHLSAQPDAAIVNVSSGLAFVPLVATPTYSATKAAVHSYTVALREALCGKIEVIELAPPAVRTELTQGQSNREGYLPLGDFMDEVMTLFAQAPTPVEILVKRVGLQRFAERENRFDATVTQINEAARRAREGR